MAERLADKAHTNPVRAFPDSEIEVSLDSYGKSWVSWMGESYDEVIAALLWKDAQGDPLPHELEELRDVLNRFSEVEEKTIPHERGVTP